MQARTLVNRHGHKLIGQDVFTEGMGEYPGGIARITEIAPDPEAPDIAFTVKHPTFGSIGIFENENVVLARVAND